MDFLFFQSNLVKFEEAHEASSFVIDFIKENQQHIKIIMRQYLLVASKRVRNSSFCVDIIKSVNKVINISNELLDSLFDLINSNEVSGFPAYFLRLLVIENVITPQQLLNKYESNITDPEYATENEFYLFAYTSPIIMQYDNFYQQQYEKAYRDHHVKNETIFRLLKEKELSKLNELLDFGYYKDSPYYAAKYDDLDLFISFAIHPNFSYDIAGLDLFEPTSVVHQQKNLIETAALFGSPRCFKYMVSNHIKYTENVLTFAIQGGNIEIIRVLEMSKNISFKNSLIDACRYLQNNVFDWLLLNKIDMKDVPYQELFHCAAMHENFYVMSFCIENFPNLKKSLVYKDIFINNKIDTVYYLLHNGEVFDLTNRKIPLLTLAAEASEELFLCIYNMPTCNINFADQYGQTTLHLIVQKRNYKLLSNLIQDDRVNINCQAKSGETPLHWAAHMKDVRAAKILLSSPKIDPSIEAKNGKTAMDIAVKNHQQEFIDLLQNYQ